MISFDDLNQTWRLFNICGVISWSPQYITSIKILLKKDGYAILLLKPQFELDNKEERLKYQNTKGIIKESLQTQFYQELKDRYKKYIINQGLAIIDIIASPIDGGDGNKEFLIFIKKESFGTLFFIDYRINLFVDYILNFYYPH